jgi:two-component system cell cycle response regulator
MRVLVADDSPAHRRALEMALEKLGHDWVSAEDGTEAWKLFQADRPEVVISDWVMPGIEGDELCRLIRASEGAYPYIIVLTSLDDKRHVMAGMQSGADDYLIKPLDTDDLEARLAAAARVTSLHARIDTQQEELEGIRREQEELARNDALTGIGNRLRMSEDLDRIDHQLSRDHGPGYTILMCDVDRFKSYNDHRGHQEGDRVLRTVAEAIASACRAGDAVYRYGGEEFAVVLADQDGGGAPTAAERFRAAVEGLGMDHPAPEQDLVTISVGVARREGALGSWEDVVRVADEALYRAKSEGRNRVVVSGADAPAPV